LNCSLFFEKLFLNVRVTEYYIIRQRRDNMENFKELTADDLRLKFDFLPSFDNTTEIACFKDIIGQERAVEAIDLGLLMEKNGYNMFVSGDSGTGKRSYIIEKLKEYAKKKETPNDWCYVYNFKDSFRPISVWLKPGTAEEFKNDIEEFINSLYEEVPKHFSDENYEKDRNKIIDRYENKVLKIADKLYDESKEKGFSVKNTSDGFAFIPLKDGEEMNEKQYNELTEEEKEELNNKVGGLKLMALEVLRKTKMFKKEMEEHLKKLDDKISFSIMDETIKRLKEKYGYNEKIIEYLKDLQEDIKENIDAFMDYEETSEAYDETFYKRYDVNVMICNRDLEGAPVIYEDNPEYHNLIGIIEYENKVSALVTDFTMIRSGSLHKANGGYIVIDALQLIRSYQGWEALKRCLKTNNICIENLKNQFDIIPIATLKPEEIPLNVKVVLLGPPYIYYLLYSYDEDFKELFKIKADFENQIKRSDETAIKILGFISNYCIENKLPPVTKNGVIEILKYSSRIAESKNYFTGSMDKVVDILEQSAIIAKTKRDNNINEKHIKEAIALIDKRYGIYRDRVLDKYREGKYIVELKGYKIGEINGLSVIDIGDFAFGKQTRITVTTFVGRDGVINIERETDLSGNIHSKGIMILSGYIGETFGQNMPLSFSASICFEQLYGGIEGDSASAAELIALISSLGDIPIKQSIAVTGSVNQKGEIQPVGGLNEKIEGFFDICSIYGLDGSHGVIIPNSNVDELILREDVIEAVEKKLFHIYAVDNIEQCFDILCEVELFRGKKKKSFEIVKERVNAKLEKYKGAFFDKSKKKEKSS
jgi:lon-related putative ATP-dependent protease